MVDERNGGLGQAATPRDRFKTAQAVLVVLLVIGLLTAIFILQNTTPAKVNFLFWSASVPLAGAFILSAVLGGILTFLIVSRGSGGSARELRLRADGLLDEQRPEVER